MYTSDVFMFDGTLLSETEIIALSPRTATVQKAKRTMTVDGVVLHVMLMRSSLSKILNCRQRNDLIARHTHGKQTKTKLTCALLFNGIV